MDAELMPPGECQCLRDVIERQALGEVPRCTSQPYGGVRSEQDVLLNQWAVGAHLQLWITADRVGGERGQAHGDILGAVGGAVLNPFSGMSNDGLASVNIKNTESVRHA